MRKQRKITRVLNTNAVLIQDDNDGEVILLGSGIGFKCKPGDLVDEHKIEKQFVIKKKEHQNYFNELINSIPQEYIMTAEEMISIAENEYHMNLNESIHISLADHIHNAVENLKSGTIVPNTLIFDIRQFYQNEYMVAKRGLTLIRERTGYGLPEDEAGFIANHFINAQYGSPNTNIKKTITFIKDIHALVRNEISIPEDENSLDYHRYMTHLKFFAQRVMTDTHLQDENNGILNPVRIQYKKEYACSKKVAKYIKEHYGYIVGRDEILYLTVHLARLKQK